MSGETELVSVALAHTQPPDPVAHRGLHPWPESPRGHVARPRGRGSRAAGQAAFRAASVPAPGRADVWANFDGLYERRRRPTEATTAYVRALARAGLAGVQAGGA